jgi:hypothetical protein
MACCWAGVRADEPMLPGGDMCAAHKAAHLAAIQRTRQQQEIRLAARKAEEDAEHAAYISGCAEADEDRRQARYLRANPHRIADGVSGVRR